GRDGWVRRADAGAQHDVVRRARRHRQRARDLRRPVLGLTALHHAASAARGRQGARVGRRLTRLVRRRDPARAVSVGRSRRGGTLVKSGVHAAGRWEWSPLYFKEISWVGSNAFGIEEVDGVRKHGIEHYTDLAGDGRIDLTGMLTHTFGLSQWQDAFFTIADQE